ncbi:MAG: AAA family ATPase [Opitutaceae bacterium]
MSTGTLKKLTIAYLRGSTCEFDLPFESGKKLTIVYGENGSGKSTACDALEFIGNGRIGSLENRGLGRPEPYWPSIGKNSADITVTLETTAGSCIAKTGPTGVVVTPEKLRPRVEVLRRTRILELIQAQAGDKYKAIERFIDVAGPETSEGALRDLIKGLKQNRRIAVAVVAENQGTIERAWTSDGKPGANGLAWAEAQSKADTTAFETESKQIEKLSLALQRVKDAVDKITPAAEVETRAKERITNANEGHYRPTGFREI